MLIVANWKATVASREKALKLFSIAKRLAGQTKHIIVLAPPAPYLGLFAAKDCGNVAFAAQDVSSVTGGAETGEIIATLLADLGISYVIVGHSERRARGESDMLIAEKVNRVFANGLIPILCVGERIRDSDAHYLQFLRNQLSTVLDTLSPKDRMNLVIAYEPVFAIGKTAADALSSTDLAEMILYIRKVLGDYLSEKSASRVKILYGGSAEPENVRELAGGSRVDGFLVGHASVGPEIFSAFIKALA